MDGMDSKTDWDAWHENYRDPSSLLSDRLRVVQRIIRDWLDATSPAPVAVMSSCAGDGRDLLAVLEGRDDAGRVTATLHEADPRNARKASERISRLKLANIVVRHADAGNSSAYADSVPADLVLLCGIFGNISDEDVHRTIAAAPQFCKHDALVVWTRHRQEPDLTPRVRAWFSDYGLSEEEFVAPDHAIYSVGVHRFLGEPWPLEADRRLFTFIR